MKKQKHLRTLALVLSGFLALSDIGNFGMSAFAKENEVVYEEDYLDEEVSSEVSSESSDDEIIRNWVLVDSEDSDDLNLIGADGEFDSSTEYLSVNDSFTSNFYISLKNDEKYKFTKAEILDKEGNIVGYNSKTNDTCTYFYIDKRDISEGKYDIKFYYGDNESIVLKDKIIITKDPVISSVTSREGGNTRDYIYLEINGINLNNKKLVPTIKRKDTELKTTVVSEGPKFIKLKKVDWPDDISLKVDEFNISFKCDDKEVYTGDVYFSDYPIVRATYNVKKNQIECVLSKKGNVSSNDASENDVTLNVYEDTYNDDKKMLCDPIKSTVDKDGIAIFKPNINLYNVAKGRFRVYLSDSNDYVTVSYSYKDNYAPVLSMDSYGIEGNEFEINLLNVDKGEYNLTYKKGDETSEKYVMEESGTIDGKDSEGKDKTLYVYSVKLKDLKAGEYYQAEVEVNGEKITHSFNIFPKDIKSLSNIYFYKNSSNDGIYFTTYCNFSSDDKITCTITDSQGKVVKENIECELRNSKENSAYKSYDLKNILRKDFPNRFYYLKIFVNGEEPKIGSATYGYEKEYGGSLCVVDSNYVYVSTTTDDDGTRFSTYVYWSKDITAPVKVMIYDKKNYSIIKTIDVEDTKNNTRYYYTKDDLKDIKSDEMYSVIVYNDIRLSFDDNIYLKVDEKNAGGNDKKDDKKDDNKDDKNDDKKDDKKDDNVAPVPAGSVIDIASKMKYSIASSFTSATGGKLKYVSSDKKIASVNKKGIVAGKKEGTATITVFDGANQLGTITFNVKKAALNSNKKVFIKLGESFKPEDLLTNLPNGSTVQFLPSKSGKVISVSDNGLYYVRKSGKYKLKAEITSNQGSSVKGSTVKISTSIKVVLPKLSKSKLTLKMGRMKQLNVKKTDLPVKWSSDKTSVAEVSDTGLVTAKGLGTCTIYAEIDGVKYPCSVTVK